MALFKPAPGPFSIADDLSQKLLRRWVPKWYAAFAKRPEDGAGFHERLGHAFRPISIGKSRLLSQLRQLAMYSHAKAQPETVLFSPDLQKHLQAIVSKYKIGWNGGWVFAVADDGEIDSTLDLYTHAFVIFACANYASSQGDDSYSRDLVANINSRELALEAAFLIDKHFRQGVTQGFTEALSAEGKPIIGKPRRHESHMHLLEACLFAQSVWDDEIFVKLADEIVGLFFNVFYDTQTNMLSEYFSTGLQPVPDAEKNEILCEPGHYYEWVWLLKKHASAKGDPKIYDDICLHLLGWANAHGWDDVHGGIYDELNPEGQVVTETKRLWPFTEALKANALMLDAVPDRDAAKDFMVKMVRLFRDKYMDERGFWIEWLSRDLTAAVDYMPATTPYHVYFGIMETREALRRRGVSKSLRAGPRRIAYATTRFFSALARNARKIK